MNLRAQSVLASGWARVALLKLGGDFSRSLGGLPQKIQDRLELLIRVALEQAFVEKRRIEANRSRENAVVPKGRATREPGPRRKVSEQQERWLVLRVVLRGKRDEELDPAPGRDLLVHGRQTFAQLARAIDGAFARWDRGDLHLFYLADGRRLGEPSDDWVMPNWAGDLDLEPGDLDEHDHTFDSLGLRARDTFEYVFDDRRAEWRHECTILRDDVEPREEFGNVPNGITPVWGWGAIPDQHGRTGPDAEADDDRYADDG